MDLLFLSDVGLFQLGNNLNKYESKEKIIVEPVIYVQATKGSFNHQAIKRLSKHKGKSWTNFQFSGTPLNTLKDAWKHGAQAFVALRNDLVPGNLVHATVEAMKEYKVIHVTAGIIHPIEMCLLRTRQAVEQQLPLQMITSHPAALAQVGKWKAGKKYKEVEEALGTAEAAKLLSKGKYSSSAGAIGSCTLAELYDNLVVIETGIQDCENNKTLFGCLQVEKRDATVSGDQVLAELKQVIEKATALAHNSGLF